MMQRRAHNTRRAPAVERSRGKGKGSVGSSGVGRWGPRTTDILIVPAAFCAELVRPRAVHRVLGRVR